MIAASYPRTGRWMWGSGARSRVACQEAGAARGADRALAVRVGAGGALRHQPVDVGRVDVAVAERADGVPALLVGADPQYVGRLGRTGCSHRAIL